MDTEDRALAEVLRSAFHADDRVARGPGEGFDRRIVNLLPDRRAALPRGGSWRVVGGIGIVALAALVGLGVVGRAASLIATSGYGSRPVATTQPGFVHGQIWDLAFDYPESWTLTGGETPTQFFGASMMALGSVGSAKVTEGCDWAPVPSGYSGNVNQACTTTWDPAADTQVRFEWNGTDGAWGLWKAIAEGAPATDGVFVGGLPARFASSTDSEHVPGSAEVIPGASSIEVWDVASPERWSWSFRITAVTRGPQAESARAAVDAMIDSVTFLPAVVPLVDTPETRAAAYQIALASQRQEAEKNPTLRKLTVKGLTAPPDSPYLSAACFSDQLGQTSETVIDGTLFWAYRLTQPLKVSCTTTVEPTAFQVWKVTFRYEWAAAATYPAGSASLVVVPDARNDGELRGWLSQEYGAASMPFIEALPRGNG